jgi:peptidoglycan/LPS O-acetylase OafA/YrhL
MLSEYKTQAILGIWGGAAFFGLGYFLISMSQAVYRFFALPIAFGGFILFVCGCVMYSKGKGHSGFWGMLGILGPLGLLILYCLKDRSKIILKKRQKAV